MVTDLTSDVYEQYKPLIKNLCLLPCFASRSINSVAVIDSGLSQSCFRVQVDEHQYFAKHITSGATEILANKLAADSGVAPKLIYAEDDWLISEFLSGELLENTQLSEDEQLTVILSLLTKCHWLPFSSNNFTSQITNTKSANTLANHSASVLPRLEIEQTISQLFQELSNQQPDVLNQQMSLTEINCLMATTESVLKELTQIRQEVGQSNEVFCHGDVNFSNVIKLENSTTNNADFRYQLIDFECACIAPIEYELGMMMAVNEIEVSKTKWVITQYTAEQNRQQYSRSSSDICPDNQQANHSEIVDNLEQMMTFPREIIAKMVTCYYILSLIINGLWYLFKFHKCQGEKYKELANKQFLLLAKQHPETDIVIK
ncbi:phosphotransferase [Cognaticolwellia mytili]|uniref:phosphotransferase n=1 Tax=Cognaticolwellia mytili TaxID=1888913 RepID=UPI000A16F195|nr:phosphotransferase [Cognaticolwellia mytili]